MPWAYYDPDSSSLKTCQRSLFDDQDSTSLPLTLPASGSLRNGHVYARPTSEPRTGGNAGSALLLTPRASRGAASTENQYLLSGSDKKGNLLPTPTTSEARGAGHAADGGVNLRTAVSLLPTPAAGNFNDGESVESWQARRSAQKERGINGNGMGTPLAIAVQLLPTPAARDWKTGTSNLIGTNARPLNEVACQLLPTPTTADGERSSSTYCRGNPTLTGALMPPPSNAGSTSSADPRQYLLNLDGEDSPG